MRNIFLLVATLLASGCADSMLTDSALADQDLRATECIPFMPGAYVAVPNGTEPYLFIEFNIIGTTTSGTGTARLSTGEFIRMTYTTTRCNQVRIMMTRTAPFAETHGVVQIVNGASEIVLSVYQADFTPYEDYVTTLRRRSPVASAEVM